MLDAMGRVFFSSRSKLPQTNSLYFLPRSAMKKRATYTTVETSKMS